MREDLFWRKVEKRGENDCWLWQGASLKGYGLFAIGRRMRRAHRVSWEAHFGPIPKNLHVLHRCDNPSCVNPKHLFIGTHLENMQDKVSKGRQARNTHVVGEMQGNAVLTEAKVRRIRKLAGKISQRQIASLVGIGQGHVSKVINRKIWNHI